jgi:hypothetical protein
VRVRVPRLFESRILIGIYVLLGVE